jgi:hypothetical protein
VTDLFRDILPTILQTKKDISTVEDFDKTYNPFIAGRALSFHWDCVLYANEINMYSGIDKRMQYAFLLQSVRGYKRPFQKWQKRETVENLALIKEYYSFSNEKAKEALTVLTDDQIDEIKKRLDRGGVKKQITV